MILTTLALNTALGIAFTLVLVFQCTPVAYYWTQLNDPHVSLSPARFVFVPFPTTYFAHID